MTLHEQAEAFLRDTALLPAFHTQEPEELRKLVAGTAISDTFDMASTEDRWIPGAHGDILVRIYRPLAEAVLPAFVFFHGGGFVLCDVEKYDPLCRKLASVTGCAVVSVDYRLAPEHPFPAAAEDAVFAAEWIAGHCAALGFDAEKLFVAGDSAGGNLAAVAAQQVQREGASVFAGQVLICPMTDFAGDYESMHRYASGYFLSREALDYFERHYLRDAGNRDLPLASPMRGPLTGLPPALIVTAEYDPLRDEAELYGRRLIEAGGTVTLRRYQGMIHGFYAMTDLFDDGHSVYEDISAFVRSQSRN
ncbi:alpha/beta hydrolase [Paenibacillus caseinilyticus]|uniref:Alpha/beta hydrolase n=1 Tax=Paenibacillus mucilaginosus K02 TaxID=997761 RepID=I0BKV7_9BACL|nr:alpha/beta hydrolase [Paenibacillus mucilaginosus]AFH63004.1 alpha/beta hydrolase [Paenibacillus mucilaginosus K02]